MAKLTLSIDEGVVRAAKRYAKARGTSVSSLVEQYLDVVARPRQPDDTPVLMQIRGILTYGERQDHRRHLERKYR